jgi:hypothetical protein
MTPELEHTLTALEGLSLGDHVDDPPAFAELLLQRQSLITTIQNADMASLSVDERTRLKGRIARVLEHDGALLARLLQKREEARRALDTLVSGRAAVRGYGSDAKVLPGALKRFG